MVVTDSAADTVFVGTPEELSLEEAGGLLDALSSESSRAILHLLSRTPTNVANLAKQLGTSTQNVTYHTQQLQNAGLIEVVGTRYSSRGREMNVYAPAQSAIVIEIVQADSKDHPVQLDIPRREQGIVAGTLWSD